MKHVNKIKIKRFFNFIVGMASILSCIAMIISVGYIINIKIELHPVLKETQYLRNEIVNHTKDTILVIQRDTIFIPAEHEDISDDYKSDYKNVLKDDEKFKIDFEESQFRKEMNEVFKNYKENK